jgi:homocysteine S-methyltransferase
MGTRLLAAGVPITTCFESLSLGEGEAIRKIHEEDIAAGARVITTNSFGANAVRLARFGLEQRVTEINCAAVQVARRAANGHDVYVAGCVGPLGMSEKHAALERIDRGKCFAEQITALATAGVDLVCLETFTRLEEMMVAFEVAQRIGVGPVICSFAGSAPGQLSCGTDLRDAFATMREAGARAFGVNCVSVADALTLADHVGAADLLAVYPSAGLPTPSRQSSLAFPATRMDFAACTRELIARGVRLIGGCCGTTGQHIRAIADTIVEQDVR